MKLEDQVTSLEISKRLRELRVKQESLFYWANTIGQEDQSCWRIEPKIEDVSMEYISAFTVAECISMLQSIQGDSIIIAIEIKNVANYLGREIIKHEEENKV